MLKVVMARGRRLKKGGGDLEVHKQQKKTKRPTFFNTSVGRILKIGIDLGGYQGGS
jgi:hypothetical protein